MAWLFRRLIFAVPLHDVHSPCRLHRLEKLQAISLQSESSFLDPEILPECLGGTQGEYNNTACFEGVAKMGEFLAELDTIGFGEKATKK